MAVLTSRVSLDPAYVYLKEGVDQRRGWDTRASRCNLPSM